MTTITVTQFAKAKLDEYLGEEPDDTIVRLLVEQDGKYGLSLDQRADGDVAIEASGTDASFVVEPAFATAVDGLKVDYLDQGASSGFSLTGGSAKPAAPESVVLRTEETPNPDARKFVLGISLGKESHTWNDAAGDDTPDYVKGVFAIEGVASVFQLDRFVSVTRTGPEVEWSDLEPKLTEILNTIQPPQVAAKEAYDKGDEGLEARVSRFIASNVAPFLQQDGGDIELVGFEGGTVQVKLHGACGTCPSAIATLHMGVERRLKEEFPGEVTALERVGAPA
jgi:Fe-S cluster biogenesis protein NfuA/Fe-S cluster assembly iron-binding protein IscA